MSYLIKPMNIRNGNTAPAIVSYCEKKDDAIADAKSKSRLSDFTNWNFSQYVKYVKDKQVKRFKQEDKDE